MYVFVCVCERERERGREREKEREEIRESAEPGLHNLFIQFEWHPNQNI